MNRHATSLSQQTQLKQHIQLSQKMSLRLGVLRTSNPHLRQWLWQMMCAAPQRVQIGGSASYPEDETDRHEWQTVSWLDQHQLDANKSQLYEWLDDQLLSRPQQLAIEALIESLNERGYIVDALSDIAAVVGCTVDALRAAQQRLHHATFPVGFENPHVFLIHQLQYIKQQMQDSIVFKKNMNAAQEVALTAFLEQLGLGGWQKLLKLLIDQTAWHQLAKRCGLLLSVADEVLLHCRSLQIHPWQPQQPDWLAEQAPELLVELTPSGWQVRPNPAVWPDWHVVHSTQASSELGGGDKDVTDWHATDWRVMQETWQMGVMTLCRIAHHVVMVQQAFFTQGRIALKILRQVDVGDALSLHSSTVSRACQAVSLQIMGGSMAGVMSLNDLFCRHASHQKALSSEAMVVIMQQLIRHEASHKPLSDQKLVDLLAQQGIQLARRTVAKIREQHGVLPARLRKKI